MNKVEKIKAEIEKRHKWYYVELSRCYKPCTQDLEAKKEECEVILSIIDSLQEEPVSADLEQEIERYQKEKVSEDLQEELQNFINDYGPMATLERCAVHFANWQKQQMIKEAVYEKPSA